MPLTTSEHVLTELAALEFIVTNKYFAILLMYNVYDRCLQMLQNKKYFPLLITFVFFFYKTDMLLLFNQCCLVKLHTRYIIIIFFFMWFAKISCNFQVIFPTSVPASSSRPGLFVQWRVSPIYTRNPSTTSVSHI